jgi:putative tricarboxylic transport membrane protein
LRRRAIAPSVQWAPPSPEEHTMTVNDRVLGVAALLLAVFLTVFGWGLEAPFAYEPVGPRAFPLGLALVIGLCGAWLVYKGGGDAEPNPEGANLRITIMAALIAAYALMFVWLGFVLANVAMVTVVGRLFGGSWVKSLTAGVVMSVAFFLLFDKLLDVVLPTGLLGGLL